MGNLKAADTSQNNCLVGAGYTTDSTQTQTCSITHTYTLVYSSCRWKSVDVWLFPEQISATCRGKSQNCVSISSWCKHSLGVVFVQMQAGVALPLTRAGSFCAGGHGWQEPGAAGRLLLDVKSVFTLMVTDLFSLFTRLLLQLCVTSSSLYFSDFFFFFFAPVYKLDYKKTLKSKSVKLANFQSAFAASSVSGKSP